MKHIYLVRHGQTDYNLKGIVQGSGVDAPLNEKGKEQADAFYRAYKNLPFDKVYTSTLQRTTQSVANFIRHAPHEKYVELNEISWGELEGKKPSPERRQKMSDLIRAWDKGQFDVAPQNGESPNEVARRQRQFVPILTHRPEEKNILICSHGRAMRVFLCVLLGLSLSKMDEFGHQNLCLYHIEFSPDRGFKVLKANDVGHLHA